MLIILEMSMLLQHLGERVIEVIVVTGRLYRCSYSEYLYQHNRIVIVLRGLEGEILVQQDIQASRAVIRRTLRHMPDQFIHYFPQVESLT